MAGTNSQFFSWLSGSICSRESAGVWQWTTEYWGPHRIRLLLWKPHCSGYFSCPGVHTYYVSLSAHSLIQFSPARLTWPTHSWTVWDKKSWLQLVRSDFAYFKLFHNVKFIIYALRMGFLHKIQKISQEWGFKDMEQPFIYFKLTGQCM